MGNWNWLTFLKVILFGIVEGITEWLPISSTGHMIILEEALGMESAFGPNGSAFWEFFLVFIQFGAILAVIAVFFKELWPWTRSKTPDDRKKIYWTWLYILIACLPAAVVGLFLDDFLDTYLYNFITVSVTLIIYGLAFIVIELFLRKAKKEPLINDLSAFTWKTALIIGAAQILSLIPGTSRSGVTILAALLIGCNRETSAKFSFYVSIPIMIGVPPSSKASSSSTKRIRWMVRKSPTSSLVPWWPSGFPSSPSSGSPPLSRITRSSALATTGLPSASS